MKTTTQNAFSIKNILMIYVNKEKAKMPPRNLRNFLKNKYKVTENIAGSISTQIYINCSYIGLILPNTSNIRTYSISTSKI